MLINSLSSNFIFNLPSDFLPEQVIRDYDGIIEEFHLPYDNIIDLLNSTIKSVTIPGLSINVVTQTTLRGHQEHHKPSNPVQDIFTTREINVVFRSVLCDLNYMLLYDIFQKHYLEIAEYIKPFTATALDIWRNGFYQVRFFQIIAISLTDNTLDYSIQKINAKEFTLTFTFNLMELDFLLNKTKVIDIGNPNILGNNGPIIYNV